MSDNLRQYRAIRAALIQGYPGEPTGRLVRHLTTLAAFISGIVASNSHSAPPWRRSMYFPRSILSTHSHTQQCYVVA